MTEGGTGRRGSYAKGVAKREEILERALDVVAREGYRGASVKEMADAAGLSQAGLLHYFDSKEELFTEILRKRDELDSARLGLGGDLSRGLNGPADREVRDLRADYLSVIRGNAEVPGLVHLFARLSVDAADPEHPAHRFFSTRGRNLRGFFAAVVAEGQSAGRITDRVDADTLARLFQAVADGIQLQWMLDPEVDMAATVDALFTLLTSEGNA
ncbi:TetR/AcrR family transcriptional regulator [Microbacterium sp. E-13]|uniref:TetR/AcrR family transcriptional regulator n=1 Tax=Microbacterium sp. E-13 TaxID=3404048 RepID=UPI003CEEB1C0